MAVYDGHDFLKILQQEAIKAKELDDSRKRVAQLQAQRILVLKEFVKKEAKRISEKKEELKKQLEKSTDIITEYEQKLPPLRNSSILKKMQEQKSRLESISETNKKLQEKRDSIRQSIKRKRQEIQESETSTKKYKVREAAELQAYIEATQTEVINSENSINIYFKCLDEKKPEDVYHCKLELGKTGYKVANCTVKPPSLEQVVEDLNTNHDFYRFIKDLRHELKKSVALS